ncbi:MAG TPA: BlaI/MecI/CopY family transcriptional regulator [Pirellulales bacterium]|jgi:predicted transcriptional regulator|nr:BlaI/MecI/CopY family transcriptional regulator [Pirellulales bacterium]
MSEIPQLSRRERQIMDAVHHLGGGTVRAIQAALPDPPTDMAVRRMLHILAEKGLLRRKSSGREVVYLAKQSRRRAGIQALRHVVNTFFGGAVEDALAAHLAQPESLSVEQLARLEALILQARQARDSKKQRSSEPSPAEKKP